MKPLFEYRRAPGRISAVPVGVRGWLALLAVVLVTVAVAAPLMVWARTFHPLAGTAVGLVVIGGIVGGFLTTVVPRIGRERR